MNDRILMFRAWDKVAKKYLFPYPQGFHLLGETTCFDLIGQQLYEREPKGNTIEKLNDVVIEQFTGFYDATPWEKVTEEQKLGLRKKTWKGLSIYENDICLVGHSSEPMLVVYQDAAFYYKSKLGLLLLCDAPQSKIIGNIRENQELLDKL